MESQFNRTHGTITHNGQMIAIIDKLPNYAGDFWDVSWSIIPAPVVITWYGFKKDKLLNSIATWVNNNNIT